MSNYVKLDLNQRRRAQSTLDAMEEFEVREQFAFELIFLRDELTELRAVLASVGVEKRGGVWMMPCNCLSCDRAHECIPPGAYGPGCPCHGTGRVPIPGVSPVAGGDK